MTSSAYLRTSIFASPRPALEPLVGLVAVGLGAEDDPRADRDRVDQRDPRQAGEQAEHEDAAVGAAQPDQHLLHRVELPGLELAQLVDRVDDAGGVVEVEVGGERLRVLGEVLADLLDEPCGVALGPEERVGDRGRDPLLEPDRELLPRLTGVALVDRRLRLPEDDADAVAQVVVEVGVEVGDAVGEGRLPARGPPLQLVGPLARLVERRDELGDGRRVVESVLLGREGEPEVGDHAGDVVGGRAQQQLVAPGQDVGMQVAHQLGEPGLLVEVGIGRRGGASRRFDDTAIIGRASPSRLRWPRSRSRTRRQSGTGRSWRPRR
jgi:hypothetical protein